MPDRKRRLLFAFTAITLLTLALLPSTRWLLRLQTRSLAIPAFMAGKREAREQRVAAAHPNDYQLQVARALAAPLLQMPTSASRIGRLKALTQQFPNEPSLYAHLLRYYAMGTVKLNRVDQDELSAEPVKRDGPAKHSAPADLQAYDAFAAQGEKLDPNNAFFPFMRAAGLYEAGRDADAIAALHRTGQKTRYEDYASDEFRAVDRLYALAHGRQGSTARVSVSAALLFPHFAVMRATARMSVVSAVHAELAGNADLGVQIRHDVMRVGDLLRAQGRSLIANLVGIAISAIQQSRPGGAPAVKNPVVQPTKAQQDQWIAEKREKYYAYLRSIGHEDEARWAKSVLDAGIQARQISAKITDVATETGPYGTRSLIKTGAWWTADAFTLANALGLLLLGGLALLAAKVRPQKHVNWWRSALGVVGIALFGLLLVNVDRLATDLYSGPIMLLNMQGESVQNTPVGMDVIARVLGIAFSLGCPFLLFLAVGIVSLKSRTSFPANLGRWLRALSVPIACGLLLLYSLLVIGTAHQEDRLSAGLDQMVTHEAAYEASLLGERWPGEVR